MDGLDALDGATWLNPPPAFDRTGGTLTVLTGEKTDFWRDTLYGFRRDSGHALLLPVDGDFTVHATFEGDYQALYDQAGIMVRGDEAHWIKAGIEFSDGVANMSVVVTRSLSDWSTVALAGAKGPQRLRLTRTGGAVVVQFRNGANRWQLMRVANFPEGPVSIGPMACSPERGGFRARFTEFAVGPAVAGALHDESPAS
jgi:regulation of enolase protein 1 (concanavalin A-like superfamily)